MARVPRLSSSYPDYAAASIGGVSFPTFALQNLAAYAQTPNENSQLGDVVIDKYGCRFQFVRCVAALTVGQVVKGATNLTGTVTAAGSTTGLVNSNITTTIDESAVGSFLSSPGTTAFTRVIKKQVAIGTNTGFYVSLSDPFIGIGQKDGDVLAAIPTDTDVLHVVRPFAVDVAGVAATPVGVAMGTVTSGNRTLVQIEGLALVSAIGSTDAITDNGIVVTAAAGQVKGTLGTATAASAIAEAKSIVGIGKMAYSGASVLVPVYLALAERF